MSKSTSSKSTSFKSVFTRIPRITARDREIHRRVAIESQSQRMVAAEYKLSQPRVSKIVQRVEKWMQHPVPKGFDEATRTERLQGAVRAHRMRLEHYLAEAVNCYEESKKPQTVKVFFDAEGKKVREERTGKLGASSPRFLEIACRFSERLLEFDGMTREGNVDLAAEDRLPEPPRWTEEELEDRLQRAVDEVSAELARRRELKESSRPEQGTPQFRQQSESCQQSADNERCKMTSGRGEPVPMSPPSPTLPLAPSSTPSPEPSREKSLSKALSPNPSANSATKPASEPVMTPASTVIKPESTVIKSPAPVIEAESKPAAPKSPIAPSNLLAEARYAHLLPFMRMLQDNFNRERERWSS
jgi:hypothetical protein